MPLLSYFCGEIRAMKQILALLTDEEYRTFQSE